VIGDVLRIRYELLHEIEQTPLFMVYAARDRVGGKEVCIRVIQSPYRSEPAFVEKLREVVRKLSVVHHPGVERVLDLDDHEGQPFLVSELPVGASLQERIKKLAPFSPSVAAAMAIGLCEALEAIHAAGVVHGDVNSANVTVTADGRTRLALAGVWESYSSSRLAGAAMLNAMAPYLAPEISAGSMPSPATDVYGVGVLLFELLTGRSPFPGDTAVSIAVKHATAPVPSARAFNPSVPVALDEITKKALAKNPADRYPDARSMLSDLRQLQDALRFGKTLTWPLSGAAASSSTRVEPETAVARAMGSKPAAKQPVGPPPKKARKVREIDEDAVPRWLMAAVYTAICVVVLMVGGWVYWNLTKPKPVKVPNLVGLPVTEAQKRLEEAGLTLRIGGRLPSEKQPADEVVGTSPQAGAEVRQGFTIRVDISTGSRFVEVPDLRGRTVDEAKAMLSSVKLGVDDQIREARDRNIEEGKIISQVPEPRRKVERDTKIRVVVSTGARGRNEREVENGIYSYTVRIKMPDGDEAVLVKVEMTDGRETKTVHEEEHQPGDSFEVNAEGIGPKATFRIFFNGEIVNQVTKEADDAPGATGGE